MDLSVLYPVKTEDRNFHWKDKLNSIDNRFGCFFLEWTGWYSQDMLQRLLGHYRLYQIFKNESSHLQLGSVSKAYIAHYRRDYGFRSLLTTLFSKFYFLATFGERYAPAIVSGINKHLLGQESDSLQQFLEAAEHDFEHAIETALCKLQGVEAKPVTIVSLPAITIYQEFNQTSQFNTANSYSYEYHQQVEAIPVKGKAKGVFSKRQWLIILDLLASSKTIEPIDYSRPNRFEDVAALLMALSGKSKDSILEELKDARNEGLYSFQTAGELKQLIAIISNISETFRAAGFRSVAKMADKKILELERKGN